MKFERVEIGARVLGHAARDADRLFFFGVGDAGVAELSALYPALSFARIHQVHGDVVTEARIDGDPVEADAHFTDRAGVAPVVVTADCIPVLLASATRVAAVHAGWRGVESNIITRAIERFTDPVIAVAIGPHLSAETFEIGRDVAARLDAARPGGAGEHRRPHTDPAKVYYDLGALARAQVIAAAGAATRVTRFTPDTKTDATYHSYRRDGARSGRNLSFVVRIP